MLDETSKCEVLQELGQVPKKELVAGEGRSAHPNAIETWTHGKNVRRAIVVSAFCHV